MGLYIRIKVYFNNIAAKEYVHDAIKEKNAFEINYIHVKHSFPNICLAFNLFRTLCVFQTEFENVFNNCHNCLTHTYITTHITYIHNWSLQPFSQDYDLISHTIYVVCVNFYT